MINDLIYIFFSGNFLSLAEFEELHHLVEQEGGAVWRDAGQILEGGEGEAEQVSAGVQLEGVRVHLGAL